MYNTFSSDSPSNDLNISASSIKTINNNGQDTGSSDSQYPVYYDQFVNKSSVTDSILLNVIDEDHSYSDVIITSGSTYEGYLFLYHRPLNNTSFNLSDGAVVTGATDYTNGIVYFSVLPTGSFELTYYAHPDTYIGDHVNAIQNALMNVQKTLGAGSNSGEGIKNASMLVKDYPGTLQTVAPNAVHISSLSSDLSVKGAPSTAVTITLGNGGDTIVIDGRNIVFKNSDASYSVSGKFGEDLNDKFYYHGPLAILATGGNLGTGHGSGASFTVGNPFASTSSGIATSATGYAMPPGSPPIARFFGDIQVIGNLWVTGDIIAMPTATGTTGTFLSSVVQIGQNLIVSGNTTLGTTSSSTTTVGGSESIGRYIHVKALGADISRLDGSIDVRNPGNINNGIGGSYSDSIVPRGTTSYPDLPFHVNQELRNVGPFTDMTLNKVTTFDGLDPSYIAKLLVNRAFDRHDYKHNTVNEGPRIGITGSVTSVSAPGVSTWFDSGLSFSTGLLPFHVGTGFPRTGYYTEGNKATRWFHLGGNYYHGKFGNENFTIASGEFSGIYQYGDGNEWYVLWKQNDTTSFVNNGAWKYGARVPLNKITPQYSSSSPYVSTGNCTVELSRSFNTAVQVGDTYELYHPSHSKPNAVRKASSTTVDVYSSPIEPIIANINGVHKIMNSVCTLSIPSTYTGYSFIYAELDTPEIAKQQNTPGSVLETNMTATLSTSLAESDSKVLLGEVYSEDPGAGVISTKTYAYNSKYDSLWFRMQNTGNLGQYNGNSEFSWWTNRLTGSTFSITTTGDLTNTGALEGTGRYFLDPEAPYDVLVSTGGLYKTRIYHNIGSMKRLANTDISVYVAPNLGNDYTAHAASFREGPDYAYMQELDPIGMSGSTVLPCYEIVHNDRNYTDIAFYNLAQIPGSIIGCRTNAGNRNYALTGTFGNTSSYGLANTPTDRTRYYWWSRVIIK